MTPLRAGVLSLLLLLGLAASADAQPIRKRPALGDAETRAQRVLELLGPEHVLREAWRTTKRYMFDRTIQDEEWELLLEAYLPKARRAKTPDEIHGVVNDMFSELKVSHLALLKNSVWERELALEFRNKKTIRGGCELVLIDGRYHVNGIAEGGPADVAGLLEGDEILALDGVATSESALLEDAGHDPGLPGHKGFVLGVKDTTPVALRVRRKAEGETFGVDLKPFPMTLTESCETSVRVEAVGQTEVGVVHLWHFMQMDIYRLLRRAIRGPLKDTDVLILDLRGRGGSARVVSAILGLFSGRRAIWKKPVLCLTDGGTRSAKEIFAWHWKDRNLGPVVGETTQGACIGCQFRQLSDGSVLMIPMQDVRRMTRGENLEGKGVAPTVPVDSAPLPYRQGRDLILEAGLEQARKLARRAVAVPF